MPAKQGTPTACPNCYHQTYAQPRRCAVQSAKNNKKKAPNEPTDPPWRYRKRGFPQKNEPKRTQTNPTPPGATGRVPRLREA
jgi:hypothetical protein